MPNFFTPLLILMNKQIKLLLLALGLGLLATTSVHATCPPDPCEEDPESCDDGNNGNGGESMPIAVIIDDMPIDIFVSE